MPDHIDEPMEVAEHPTVDPEALATRPYRRRADRIQTSAQIIMAIAIVLALSYVAKPVLIVLLASVLLAFMLAPIVDGLQRVRVPRSLGAVVALLVLCAILYGTSFFFYYRAVAFVRQLPTYTEKIRQEVDKVQQQAHRIQSSTSILPPEKPGSSITVHQETDWTSTLTQGAGAVWDLALTVSFVPSLCISC